MKTSLTATVTAACLALAACGGLQSEDPHAIKVSGNIELNEVEIAFKTSGRLIERTVDEGDIVRKGMVVARLDREQLLRQRDRESAALAAAEAMLAQARTSAKMTGQTLQADLDLRHAELRSAEVHLQELKNGSRPQEIREAKAAVEAAQSENDRAKKDWDRAQTLFKNDDISASQFDQFRTRAESAAAALRQAQERSSMVTAGPRTETIDAANTQVARARAGLAANAANQLETTLRKDEITAREADIEREKAQLALIDSQLADTIAIAPISGVVLVKSVDVGEIVSPGTSIVTVGDIDHPWLRAYINEKDMGRTKIGASATVTTDSFPGKKYTGRVSYIASQAEFTPKQIQTSEERVKLVYRIKIELENSAHELKSNMPADALIQAGN
jgi:HlyD family secretion protein